MANPSGGIKPVLWFLEFLTADIENGVKLAKVRQNLFDAALNEVLRRAPSAIRGSFRVFDETRKHLRFVAYKGEGWTPKRLEALYFMDDKSSGIKVVRTKKAHYVRELDPDNPEEWYRKLFDDVKALCSLPVFEKDKLVGVLTLHFKEAQQFPEQQKALLEGVATECTQILNRFVLIEDAWLLELNQKLDAAAPHGIEPVCQLAASEVQRIFGVGGCSVFVYDSRRALLTIKGSTKPNQPHSTGYRLGDGLTGWTALHKTTLRIRDYRNRNELAQVQRELGFLEPPLEHSGQFDDLDPEAASAPRTFLATALVVSGRLVGVIRLSRKVDDPVEFQRDDEVSLQRIAGTLALIIENIQLHEGPREFIDRVETIAAAFAKTLELDGLLRSITDVARDYADMEWAVMRVRTGRGAWKAEFALNNSGESFLVNVRDEIEDDHPIIRRALAQDDPEPYDVSSPEFQSYVKSMAPSAYRDFLSAIKLILLIPIRLEREPLGILSLGSSTNKTPDQRTIYGLRILTTYAALAKRIVDLLQTKENPVQMLKALTLCAQMYAELPHSVDAHIQRLKEMISASPLGNTVDLREIGGEVAKMNATVLKTEQEILQASIAAPRTVDLAAFVSDFAADQKKYFEPTKNIAIDCRIAPLDSCNIMCNPVQLKTMLRLLTVNAVQALEERAGGPGHKGHIVYEIRRVENLVKLQVSDDGIGMAPNQIEELDTVVRRPRPGHRGISIPAVRAFMELHEGKMTIDSQLGQGTSVTLSFPSI
jgi:signal transduction histidine kinase